ncbi:MAG: PQQ-binding-like beta-propeller repeat protein, partial [Fimbriimonas sp.]|nr:PQQ-binding-like beta-propeller repeat protein [Fimbriimonas sp.]
MTLLALALMASIVTDTPRAWTSFRGNPQNSGTTSATVALPLRQSWSIVLDGPIEATAAIKDGFGYVGTTTGSLYKIRLSDRHVEWRFRSPSAFSSSPTLADGSVFLGDEGGVFYSVDASTGRQRWKYQTGDKIVSSGSILGDAVVFGSYDGRATCLLRSNGHRKWVYTTQAPIHGTPAVTPYGVVVAGCDGHAHLLRTTNGKQIAAFAIGTNVAASPAVMGTMVYVASISAQYTAIDLMHRKIVWKEAEREEGAACHAGASFADGLVMFGSRSRRVFAVDSRTGVGKWTFRTKEAVDSAPVVAGKVAFFGCDDGFFYAVRASD